MSGEFRVWSGSGAASFAQCDGLWDRCDRRDECLLGIAGGRSAEDEQPMHKCLDPCYCTSASLKANFC